MAPNYKLTYFNGMGLAESIRFLLCYMEEEFEDVRIEREHWASMKYATPFGQLPILEENGKPLVQSQAICRYLGKKAGLAGKDDWENVQIDIIADTLTDIRIPLSAIYRETNEDIKKAKKETYVKETLPFYMKKLDDIVKENKGYLANEKLSWIDFVFSSLTEVFSIATNVTDVNADYPNLHDLRERIINMPPIKKWIANRPITEF